MKTININPTISFMHCWKCLEEKPANVSPRQFAKIEVGLTKPGIMVWCVRHELKIAHFDLLGQKIAPI